MRGKQELKIGWYGINNHLKSVPPYMLTGRKVQFPDLNDPVLLCE